MKLKLILASLFTMGIMNVAFASVSGNACTNAKGHDPLVGVWYGSFSADDAYNGYGTVTIHADGTAMAADTTNTGGLGNLGTAPTGIWNKVGPNNYEITAITIYSSTATLPGPTSPVYTFVANTKVQLSDDCTQITSYDNTYSIFAPSDINFENPLRSGTLNQTYTRVTQNTGK